MTIEELTKFYKDKRVLVTGRAGFKGAWLSRILTLVGAKVTGYVLEPPTDPGLFEIAGLEDTTESVTGDVRGLKHLRDVFERVEPEIVFYLVAQPIMRDSYKDPVCTYETNVMGTVHVMECVWLTENARSFLNMIMDEMYENKEWEYGHREDDPLDGFDPYSNSKPRSELVTHSHQKSFLSRGRCAVSTSRVGNVTGGGNFVNDRIIPDCVRAAATGKDITVRNPYSTRPCQLMLEPLVAYLTIVMKQYEDRRYQGHYSVGLDDKDCITTGHLVDIFCRVWGQGIKWIDRYDGGPHETGLLKLDCSRIKSVFGWQPRYGVEEAVTETVEQPRVYSKDEEMLEVMDRQIREFSIREN